MVEAKAKAKPAIEALMVGVMRQTKAVDPTIPADKRLKRTDNQRLTAARLRITQQRKMPSLTSPHPVIRIGVLKKRCS